MYSNLSKYLVEFLGTLFFLHVILATGNALAIGAALALVILIGGPVSGGNFNPAVTIMMAAAKKMPLSDVAPYIISQVAGGIAAIQLHKIHLAYLA
jgi:glycerol uptake facilitator-like aquaporin